MDTTGTGWGEPLRVIDDIDFGDTVSVGIMTHTANTRGNYTVVIEDILFTAGNAVGQN